MSNPEIQLGRLAASERRLWQQHERARLAGESNEVLQPIRQAATETGENRRELWRRSYEEGRERSR